MKKRSKRKKSKENFLKQKKLIKNSDKKKEYQKYYMYVIMFSSLTESGKYSVSFVRSSKLRVGYKQAAKWVVNIRFDKRMQNMLCMERG